MPLGNQSVEWLNLNAQRRYPLAEGASCADTSRIFMLPNDFLVALDIPVHAGLDVAPSQFFIRQIGAYESGYSIIIAYKPAGSDAVDVATALIPKVSHTPNTVYSVGGLDDFADVVGKITIGSLANIGLQPPGVYTFELADTRIDPDCIRPNLRGITSFAVVSADGTVGTRLYGDIEFVAATNIQLTTAVASGISRITISAKSGEGLSTACACSGNSASTPIRTIDGIAPDASGNINLIGDSCVQLQGVDAGIAMTDACSKPCCGCDELQQVNTAMTALSMQVPTLAGYISRLDAQLSALNTLLTGSNIGQSNCGT